MGFKVHSEPNSLGLCAPRKRNSAQVGEEQLPLLPLLQEESGTVWCLSKPLCSAWHVPQAGREILLGMRRLIIEIMRLGLKIPGLNSCVGQESLGNAAGPKLCLCPGWDLVPGGAGGVCAHINTGLGVLGQRFTLSPVPQGGHSLGELMKEPHPSVGLGLGTQDSDPSPKSSITTLH